MKKTKQQASRSNAITTNPKVSFSSAMLSQFLETHQIDENDENRREVSYRSKGLTADDIQTISTFFSDAVELDLSENKMEYLPRGVHAGILALNLSRNRFHSLVGFDQVKNLKVLKLFGNKIERTWGLQACVQLEYLDLSENNISVIEGLETLTKLTTLILTNNRIKKMGSIRPLSFNTSLQELQLTGNDITSLQNYSGAIKHLIVSLKTLDGEPLYFKDGNRANGYGVKYDCKKIAEQSTYHEAIRSVEHRAYSEWGDISMRWDEQDGTVRRNISSKKAQPSCGNGIGNDSIISASSTLLNQTIEDEELLLPWRRAPFPIPKDRKGNDMYEAPPSPPQSPRQQSPLRGLLKNKSTNKSTQDKNSSHSNHTNKSPNPKKEVSKTKVGTAMPSPSILGSTFATNLKGGMFDRPASHSPTTRRVSTGMISPEASLSSQKLRTQRGSLSASARAANIKYPVFQPNFSPPEPPPPPPPRNKYKVTLGTKKVSTKSMKKGQDMHMKMIEGKDSHLPQNDVLRIQVYDNDDPDYTPYRNSTLLSTDKKNILENTNRPIYVRSNTGGVTRMDGLPILADDDLRQAVSPRKMTQPIHRSLSIDDNDDNQSGDNSPSNPTSKIISEYRSRGGITGVSLNPVKNKWTPPPLPIEQMYDNNYDDEYYNEDGYGSDENDNSEDEYEDGEEDDSRNETVDSQESQLIHDALQVFYDQKRNTIQNIKSNKVANDPLMFMSR